MLAKTTYFSHCWGVFEGGGVRAAAHAGAYTAARNAGIVFGRVAGTSAGSIVAALIAAGASADEITQLLMELDFGKLLAPIERKDAVFSSYSSWALLAKSMTWGKTNKFVTIALHSGLYSSVFLENWVESQLKTLIKKSKGIDANVTVKFSDLILPLHVVATDVSTGKPKVWSSDTTPDDSVAYAVRCSSTIPFFYQAINHQQSVLVDGGAISNLPAFVFSNLINEGMDRSVLSRILAFRLVEKQNRRDISGVIDFVLRLSDAMIDGATHIQTTLQPHVYHISIPTGTIKSTDFEIKQKEKENLYDAGKKAVEEFVQEERLRVSNRKVSQVYQGFDEKMLLLVQELQSCKSVFVAVGKNTYWLEHVFPSILAIARRGIKIIVITPLPDTNNKDEQRRQWLLGELGAEIKQNPLDSPQFEGFVFDINLDKACVLFATQQQNDDNSEEHFSNEKIRLYTQDRDPAVLEMLIAKLTKIVTIESSSLTPRTLEYRVCDEKKLFELLKKIPQYQSAKFKMVEIPIDDNLLVIQRTVKEFKFLQIKNHMNDIEQKSFTLFALLEVVLPSGKSTIVTPPILEKVGNKLVIIEGNTRFFNCLNLGLKSVKAVVVENVTEELPAKSPQSLSTLRLTSSTTTIKDMYTNVDKSLFRRIEAAAHPYPVL